MAVAEELESQMRMTDVDLEVGSGKWARYAPSILTSTDVTAAPESPQSKTTSHLLFTPISFDIITNYHFIR